MIHHHIRSLPGGTVVVLHNTSQTTTVDTPEWHSKINLFTDWNELALPYPGRCGCHSLLELFATSPTGVTILSHPGRCGHHSHLVLYNLTHRWSHTFTSRKMWPPLTPCALLSHPQVTQYLHIQVNVAAIPTLHSVQAHPQIAPYLHIQVDVIWLNRIWPDLKKKVILIALLQILPQVDVSASSSVSSTCLYLISYCQCQIHLLMSVNSSVKFHHPGPVSPVLQHQFQQTICIHLCQFCPPQSVSPSSVSSALRRQSCL